MNSNKYKVIGLVLLTLIAGLLLSCAPSDYKSNGERIFFTATSASGKPISAQGFTMMQGRISCANCHGADGHGGEVSLMMSRFEAANITWDVLTGPYEDHAAYNEKTLKDAISKAVDPNGKRLGSPMPVWQMADEDLNDLIAFLKTLK
jgi:cytochrome c oxidase subunit 2